MVKFVIGFGYFFLEFLNMGCKKFKTCRRPFLSLSCRLERSMIERVLLITTLLLATNVDLLFSSCSAEDFFVEKEEIECFLRGSLKSSFEIGEKLPSFSNSNFIVQEVLTGDRWVLRVPHEISNLLSNRTQEKEVLEWARREQVFLLEIKDCNLKKGYLLSRFLSGREASASDFQDEINLRDALRLLHHVHSSKTIPLTTKFQPLSRFIATAGVAANRGLSLPLELYELADQLSHFLLQIPIFHFDSVPCHNDPSPGNFFFQNDSLYLGDWEFAGFNDSMWDLAHFSVIAQVDPEKILNIYQTSDLLALEKMTFFKPFVLFNTVIWAALECQQSVTVIPREITEGLYQTFLQKIRDSIENSFFHVSLQRLIQGGHL